MTVKRGWKYLMLITAALVMVALAGNLRGMPAGAAGQQGGTTMQDCAACHDEVAKAFEKTPHEALEKVAAVKVANACESCHGPGKAHMDGGGDKAKIVTFKGKESKKYTEQCLACHKNSRSVNGYMGSVHGKQGLDCADCHSVHKAAPMTRMLKGRSSEMCMTCHTQQKTEFAKPFHHRVKEGAMGCEDCHQPHSGVDGRQVRVSYGGQEICMKCHAEKKGPYVYEHAAIRLRGCEGCHETHGSVNPKMLVRANMTSLCLECHTKVVGASSKVLGSEPPSFHNLNNPTYRNCTTCHVMIHGSNFDRLFLK